MPRVIGGRRFGRARHDGAAVAAPHGTPMSLKVAIVKGDWRARARPAPACRMSPPILQAIFWLKIAMRGAWLVTRARIALSAAIGCLADSLRCPAAIPRKDGHPQLISKAAVDIQLSKYGNTYASHELRVHCWRPQAWSDAHMCADYCKVFWSMVTDSGEGK